MKKYYKCTKCGSILAVEEKVVGESGKGAIYTLTCALCERSYINTQIKDDSIIITRANDSIINALVEMGYRFGAESVLTSTLNNGWIAEKEFMAIEGNEIKLLKTINYPKYLFMGNSDSFLFWAKILIEDRK